MIFWFKVYFVFYFVLVSHNVDGNQSFRTSGFKQKQLICCIWHFEYVCECSIKAFFKPTQLSYRFLSFSHNVGRNQSFANVNISNKSFTFVVGFVQFQYFCECSCHLDILIIFSPTFCVKTNSPYFVNERTHEVTKCENGCKKCDINYSETLNKPKTCINRKSV